MARIALVGPEISGHMFPLCALGHELHSRGHDVQLFGRLDGDSFARGAGLGFQSLGETKFPRGSSAESFAQLGQLTGRAAIRFTVREFLASSRMLLDELPAALGRWQPDAVLVDQSVPAGASVCEHLRLGYASVACALLLNREPRVPPIVTPWSYAPGWWGRCRNRLGYAVLNRLMRPVLKPVDQQRQRWNLPIVTNVNDRFSPVLQLVQIPREFDFPRQQLSSAVHYVGPLSRLQSRKQTDFPYNKLTGQPLIYASLGTLQNRLQPVFQAIVDACRDIDGQLVLSAGGGHPGELRNLPTSAIVVPFAPQLELLQQASVVITHAGLNTTMESLAQGLPLICLPITNDQPGVAARVVHHGCGVRVPIKRVTAARLKIAIAEIHADQRIRENCRRMQQKIASSGGVSAAADLFEEKLLQS